MSGTDRGLVKKVRLQSTEVTCVGLIKEVLNIGIVFVLSGCYCRECFTYSVLFYRAVPREEVP